MLDFTVGTWQRVVIKAVADAPCSVDDVRALLRRLGHYPSRSAMACSVDGLLRREILARDPEGMLSRGPSWQDAVRRYCGSDERLARVA
jgi:hypothetical protein